MYEKRELYRAIAEVAYAIARAGDGLQSEEREQFFSIINSHLDFDSWSALSRFEILEEMHPDPMNAYEYALSEIRKYKHYLTPEIKAHGMEVANAVAEAYHGKNIQELNLLDRFKKALE
ncbi:MAG: hypothetical protein ACNS60_18955 [Candidatus Cyclobacteriaceae bacterium M2_1C_046]